MSVDLCQQYAKNLYPDQNAFLARHFDNQPGFCYIDHLQSIDDGLDNHTSHSTVIYGPIYGPNSYYNIYTTRREYVVCTLVL